MSPVQRLLSPSSWVGACFFGVFFFFSRFLVTIPVLWSHPRMVLWACMDVTLLPVELETGEKADKNDPFQCFRRDVWTVTG